ncbi:hypothetical protein [Silvimonas iriomotensis]|uniref:hypothetical protein n=1 Tax=Silvimonas iriomotensis TaxID=449662 RepID=UPI00166D3094|nr:hypothetical protein [Silvimonas iriomotensis]
MWLFDGQERKKDDFSHPFLLNGHQRLSLDDIYMRWRRGCFTLLYVLILFAPSLLGMEGLIDWFSTWVSVVSALYAGLMMRFAGSASKTALLAVFLMTIVFPVGTLMLVGATSGVTLAAAGQSLRDLYEMPEFWRHTAGLFHPLFATGVVVGLFLWCRRDSQLPRVDSGR